MAHGGSCTFEEGLCGCKQGGKKLRACGTSKVSPGGRLTGVLQGTFEKGMFTCVVWLC